MAEEATASEASVIESEGTIPVNALETQNSEEATIKSFAQGGTESTCNNDIVDDNNGAETSATTCSDGEREKSLEYADELMEKGSEALKDSDFSEATECFSRALEIRVAHYGELSPECINAYYKYGRALLYKAQEEADPLASVPKKEGESEQDSAKDGSDKNVINGDSTAASGSSNAENDVSLNRQEGEDEASGGKDKEEDEEDSDVEEQAADEADEDDSDLDLAWKMLDVARAIVEKDSGDTMEKVDILSALAEVALEREDIETSLGDYNKALSILERLVEPDSRHLAELYFRICLCLEIGSKPQEAILYCQKAISVFKARVQRLMNEIKSNPDKDKGLQQTSIVSQVDTYTTDKQVEIVTLTGLSVDLEKKLEDLEQLASNPKSILSEILGMAAAAKAKGGERGASSVQVGSANSNVGFDSPTASTDHTNGNGSSAVTHLGVVGRGVKRVLMSSGTAESNPTKKSASHLTDDKGDGKTS